MEQTDTIYTMLDHMERPAFLVRDGRICRANAAATRYLIEEGTEVEPLLSTGRQEYAEYQSGCLHLTLRICGTTLGASVTRVEQLDMFVLDAVENGAELQAMALAARELRQPLSNIMSVADRLFPIAGADSDPALQDQIARINRGLFQMLRIVGNMSIQTSPRLEMQDVDAVLRELWEKAESACESRGVKLRYRGTGRPLYSNIDTQLLTRAIHNLLSNSLKFAADGGLIELELSAGKKYYRITVRDWGTSVSPDLDLLNHWRREPGIEDGRTGLGLGLKLVQLAAAAHNGTVWFDRLKGEGFRVIMSLPINQDTRMCSPRYRVSYSGDRDPLLLELSDVLPPEFYQ